MPSVAVAESAPAPMAKEAAKSVVILEELIKKLTISKEQEEANAAANNIATLLNGPIEEKTMPAK